MDVTRDFLSALYQHAIGTLWRQNGQAVMSMTRVDFVLTVPAVWSDTAKQSASLSLSSPGLRGCGWGDWDRLMDYRN